MLDSHVTLLSIEATSNTKLEGGSDALLMKGCNVYIFSSDRIYSEFDEYTFSELNHDDYQCGALDIEFVLSNDVTKEAYPDFYTKCFVIRTDTHAHIKPMNLRNEKCNSKINQSGDLVLGIRYYFRDKKEVSLIQDCNSLLVEGFLALQKPKNVYGIMCQLEKESTIWKISSAYTYKPKYAKNIRYLID